MFFYNVPSYVSQESEKYPPSELAELDEESSCLQGIGLPAYISFIDIQKSHELLRNMIVKTPWNPNIFSELLNF